MFRSNLKKAMEPWLAGTNSDHFTYDTTWGGLITTKAMDDGGADFGQGRHF
jgi:endo-1,3(4)-beta-glucanase